jgi:hypothetical protein
MMQQGGVMSKECMQPAIPLDSKEKALMVPPKIILWTEFKVSNPSCLLFIPLREAIY